MVIEASQRQLTSQLNYLVTIVQCHSGYSARGGDSTSASRHHAVFRAYVSLTQIGINNGDFIWNVEYQTLMKKYSINLLIYM